MLWPRFAEGYYGLSSRYATSSGDKLGNIQPDKDSVGVFIERNSLRHGREFVYRENDDLDNNAMRAMWKRLQLIMTLPQFTGSAYGLAAAQASGGKRALKKLFDREKLQLIKWGAHVAAAGTVVPKQCWKIDKLKSHLIFEDGSNFFRLAKQIR